MRFIDVRSPECLLDRETLFPNQSQSLFSEFEFVAHAQRPVWADDPSRADVLDEQEVLLG